MTIWVLEENFHLRNYSNGWNSDAFGTPSITVFGCKNFERTKQIAKIVHRLAHAHKHEICEFISLGHRHYLIQNFGSSKVGRKALFAGHAKQAVHFAAHLRRYAKRVTIVLGNIHRFDKVVGFGAEKVLFSTIDRLGNSRRQFAPYSISFFQQFTVFHRDIRHFVDTTGTLLIKPVGNLFGSKCRHSQLCHQIAKLINIFA